MRSSPRCRCLRFALCIALVCGCGGGVSSIDDHDVDHPTLVGEVMGEVDPSRIDGQVRVGLVWGGVPKWQHFCLMQPTHPIALMGCTDARRFSAYVVDMSTPVDLDVSRKFSFTLTELPPQYALVRTEAGYIAYGSVVAYVDRNANQRLDLIDPIVQGTMDVTCARDTSAACTQRDRIIGTSFLLLDQPQMRVVYREGNYTNDSLYYPARACSTPPLGYSVLSTMDALAEDTPCVNQPITTAITVHVLPDELLRGIQCIARVPRSTYPFRAPLCVVQAACLDDETLVFADPTAVCPTLFEYTLRGCWRDPMCETPDWDLRAEPPAWWPCGGDGKEIECDPTETALSELLR